MIMVYNDDGWNAIAGILAAKPRTNGDQNRCKQDVACVGLGLWYSIGKPMGHAQLATVKYGQNFQKSTEDQSCW